MSFRTCFLTDFSQNKVLADLNWKPERLNGQAQSIINSDHPCGHVHIGSIQEVSKKEADFQVQHFEFSPV